MPIPIHYWAANNLQLQEGKRAFGLHVLQASSSKRQDQIHSRERAFYCAVDRNRYTTRFTHFLNSIIFKFSLISVKIDGDIYHGESQRKRIANEKVIRDVLSSFTAEDMDHMAKLTNEKLKKAEQDVSSFSIQADTSK